MKSAGVNFSDFHKFYDFQILRGTGKGCISLYFQGIAGSCCGIVALVVLQNCDLEKFEV